MDRPDTICKTVHQYNKERIPAEDMQKLQEIAKDYSKVKNYVYARYGGIASLAKLYPGYTIQNEMTASGLRSQLELPSVYFYLAVFDALGDIKSQWTRTKSKVLRQIRQNEGFTEEEKHYLRFLLKVNNAFEAVLNQHSIILLPDIQEQYEALAKKVDIPKLHRYLCRQVRRCLVKIHTGTESGFSISERAYRYADHGIYISTKEKRKRIFVELTDSNQYKSQLYIKLYPLEGNLEIKAAIQVAVRAHEDYTNRIGLSMGMLTMLTTHEGHSYGEKLGQYQLEYADWIQKQTGSYHQNRQDNPGRKKYNAKKNRLKERMNSYINHELNRFLQTEKPQIIYIVKLPASQAGGKNRKINHSTNMWQRGYIRSRLEQKCKEQSVDIVEVLGKDISTQCSSCGKTGNRKNGNFDCPACGYHIEEKTNTARNVLQRGIEGKILNNFDHKNSALDKS